MKKQYYLSAILCLTISISNFSQEIEFDKFVYEYNNKKYSVEILGKVIINQYPKNNLDIYEIHVNPSLMELIIFDKSNKLLKKYYYTNYYIDINNNIITLLSPPHFNTPDEYLNIWKIYINNELKYNSVKINGKIRFEENATQIIIYSEEEIVLIMEKK
jgi:hypothetical protein